MFTWYGTPCKIRAKPGIGASKLVNLPCKIRGIFTWYGTTWHVGDPEAEAAAAATPVVAATTEIAAIAGTTAVAKATAPTTTAT